MDRSGREENNLESREILNRIFEDFPSIRTIDIPGIDLYMDQVTTFLQDSLRSLSRDPEGDKFLTKTMINNYVKNRVILPPVKKKYSREHMMLLIMIYYMKSFLSISDIRSITTPVMECCAGWPGDGADRKKGAAETGRKDAPDRKREASAHRRESADKRTGDSDSHKGTGEAAEAAKKGKKYGICELYEEIAAGIREGLPSIRSEIEEQIELSQKDFSDASGEDREFLKRFSLICRLSAEVYMRKLFIEKLLDSSREKE